MVAQYLSPHAHLYGAALIAIQWPRLGMSLHALSALVAFTVSAVLRRCGDALHHHAALALCAVLGWSSTATPACHIPGYWLALMTFIGADVEPVMRVAALSSDGNLGARVVAGNGVTLTWAPAGRGSHHEGMDWCAATEACQYLADDGLTVATTAQHIWRLPTVEKRWCASMAPPRR
ncbi:MAG: hypothetical protein R2932_42215 [Caldilineaceae bacterium]